MKVEMLGKFRVVIRLHPFFFFVEMVGSVINESIE